MKRKISAILKFIWVIAVLLIAVIHFSDGYFHKSEYHADTKLAQSGNTLYAAQKEGADWKLYRIEEGTKVQRVISLSESKKNVECVALSAGDKIDVLLKYNQTEQTETDVLYEIITFSAELERESGENGVTFLGKEGLTGFSRTEKVYYLTFVNEKGSLASVYSVPAKTVEKEADGKETDSLAEAKEIHMESVVDGRRIQLANYKSGRMLFYLDNGQGKADFVPTDKQIERFNARELTASQYIGMYTDRIFWYVAILIAGIIVLLAQDAFVRRGRLAQLIVAWETILLVAAIGLVWFAFRIEYQQKNAKLEELTKWYMASTAAGEVFRQLPGEKEIQDYYDSPQYAKQTKAMCQLLLQTGVEDALEQIYLVDRGTGTILAGTDIWNGRSLSELYTQKVDQLLSGLDSASHFDWYKTKAQGRTLALGGIGIENQPSYALVGVMSQDYGEKSWQELLWRDVLIGLFAYVIMSCIGIWFLTIQSRDIKRLNTALQGVTEGGKNVKRPVVHGRDMENLWNSINETDKTLKKMNYDKLQMFEAYYRFAPKEIENLLHKKSILEVSAGDQCRLEGCMAILKLELSGRDITLANRNHFLQLLENHQTQRKGIVISNNVDLSELRVLFASEQDECLGFAVDLIRELEEEPPIQRIPLTIFLYQAQFEYGVAGTERQCFTYLNTDGLQTQDCYAAWLGKMGLRVVATGEVLDKTNGKAELRYLGYVETEKGQKKLYEVLDACPARERRIKVQNKEKFEKALQLFYQKDFYLARSLFTEILRELPQDNISKWYLFTCEKYLNETYSDELDCGLHLD